MDELFAEIDRSLERGRTDVDEREAAEGAEWLKRIEDENADELTPERIAALEAAAARANDGDEAEAVANALTSNGDDGDTAPESDGARGGGEGDGVTTVAGRERVEHAKRERTRLDEDVSPTAGRRFTRR